MHRQPSISRQQKPCVQHRLRLFRKFKVNSRPACAARRLALSQSLVAGAMGASSPADAPYAVAKL